MTEGFSQLGKLDWHEAAVMHVMNVGCSQVWCPRMFDFFGASHQLLHLCVLAAAVLHWINMQSARDTTYNDIIC